MSATVLVIEDYSAHRALLHAVVGRLGCQAIDAADGRTGLELARQHHPTMIVLDMILPDLDGVEVLKRLRNDPATAATPVLVVTALDADERLVEALEAGADDYVTKPFDNAVLLARMKVHLRAARLQRDLTERARQAESVAELARASASGSDLGTLCGEVAAALRLSDVAEQVLLYLLRDDKLVGPFGSDGAPYSVQSVASLLHSPVMGRVLCGEVPWQRLLREELGPLTVGLAGTEAVVLPLRHGRDVLGLAVMSSSQGPIREAGLRRVAALAESAALALSDGVARASKAESETRYRLLFEQAGDGVAIIDPVSGACRETNQTLAGWLSAVPSALGGRPFAALFDPEQVGQVVEAVTAAGNGQRSTIADLRVVDADGHTVPVEVTLRRVKHCAGADIIAILRDLRARDAWGRYRRAAGDLSRLARTVRALNHEINNPLTCIIGLTQLLQLRLRDLPEHLPQLDRILESADQITGFGRQLREVAILLGGDDPIEEISATLDELSASHGR